MYPQFIHQARQQVKQAIAPAHGQALEAFRQSLSVDKPYRPEANDIAEPTLKNICLSYLTGLDDKAQLALAEHKSL